MGKIVIKKNVRKYDRIRILQKLHSCRPLSVQMRNEQTRLDCENQNCPEIKFGITLFALKYPKPIYGFSLGAPLPHLTVLILTPKDVSKTVRSPVDGAAAELIPIWLAASRWPVALLAGACCRAKVDV